MIDSLEALYALHDHFTMEKAASELRLTQSAISKRIASLENQAGAKLIVRVGRKVELTAFALALVQRTRPLIAELRESMNERPTSVHTLEVGFSESILISYGATVLQRLGRESFIIRPHAHRGPVVIDRVSAGQYAMGICAGFCSKSAALSLKEIGHEPMVLVGPKEKALVSAEESSETWKAIDSQVRRLNLKVEQRLESFAAMAQLAKSGVVQALIPLGVARAMGMSGAKIRRVNVKRPVIMIARKTLLERSDMASFVSKMDEQLKLALKNLIEKS